MLCPGMGDGTPIPCTATYQKWTGQPVHFGKQLESPAFRLGECQLTVSTIPFNILPDFFKRELFRRLCDKLLYHLKYRNCDAKVLEMFILFFKVGNTMEPFDEIKDNN